MKNLIIGSAMVSLTAAVPLSAQESPLVVVAQPVASAEEEQGADDLAQALSSDPEWRAMMEAFKPEPLTAEQEARLPLAREVMAMMMPDGAMTEMFGTMFDDFLGPLSSIENANKTGAAVELLGWSIDPDDIDAGEAAEIVAILDPAREEREAIGRAAFQRGMTDAMTTMEPAMREAMSRAYAATFDDHELIDIKAFFQTPSGAAFARKSYRIASDPTMFMSVMEELPQIMAPMMAAMKESEAQIAALPQQKDYAALSDAERARLMALTGLDAAELEVGLSVWEESEELEPIEIEMNPVVDE